ncbi:putative anti-sigma regulatory factor, serine/threonine protein kinase [Candidatus Koribacter versatilis Ellin345]|uniref:Anti-sigma regulatory factor, serine/threonine protein kinase n=1 Tax=Koribacter versatilis (strain Ellin345) TaxID=204669 RepID=Q1IP82_KORVE|nr:ATP-binding protein [Candidatus Koribacter versatilis]ABF41318.1 putative anti-sigma regulatory factor, serine/threonine protein kinase [Candidatus Koribacter versatilis Ellin345]
MSLPLHTRMSSEQNSGAFAFGRSEHGVTITLKAAESEVSPVVDQIMHMVNETGCCAPGKELDVEIALREALANAIKHGANGDPSKTVECRVSCGDSGILIVVRDPGPGFDPAAIPDPLSSENIFSNHGRGIFLINKLMDEVKFEKNGTEIHMRKY